MEAADLDEVLRIENASFPNPWSRSLFESELKNPISCCYTLKLGADKRARLGAYIVFWMLHGEAHILNIATAPDLRRMGLAREMLGFSIARMRESLVFEVFLEVRKSNAAALSLYREMGFKESYVRKKYYQNEDAIVMTLDL